MFAKKLLAGLIFGTSLAQETVEETTATVVDTDHIGADCLTKGTLVGATASTSPLFDQSDFILEKFDKDQYPTYLRECREDPVPDSSRQLISFLLQTNNRELLNAHVSPAVGPTNIGTCKDIKFQNDQAIIKGTIWHEDTRVNGVFLEFTDGYVQPIGLTIGTPFDVDFSDSSSFIGFYGISNDSYIEALGFLTQDLACEGTPHTDDKENGNHNNVPGKKDDEQNLISDEYVSKSGSSSNKDDDDDSTTTTIIIIVVVVVAVVLIVVLGMLIRNKRAANKRIGQVQVLQTDSGRMESQGELKSTPAVNATQNTLPVIDTDEEANSNVNIGTHRSKGAEGEKPGPSAIQGKRDSGMDMTM